MFDLPTCFRPVFPVVPAHSKIIVPCHVPDLSGNMATTLHGQDFFIGTDLLSPEQITTSASIEEGVTRLNAMAESDGCKASLLAFVSNRTNDDIYLESNYIVGHGSLMPLVQEGEISFEQWQEANSWIKDMDVNTLILLKSRLDHYAAHMQEENPEQENEPKLRSHLPKSSSTRNSKDPEVVEDFDSWNRRRREFHARSEQEVSLNPPIFSANSELLFGDSSVPF